MRDILRPTRVMIDRQSEDSPGHEYNRMVGIAMPDEGGSCLVYFTEGPVHSMLVPKSWLTEIKITVDNSF